MTVELPPESDWKVCPKRMWILHTFSDDECLGDNGELPRGLQFHLSRCASCRALAERLRSVSDMLEAISSLKPSDEIADRANQQLSAALDSGARCTGSVNAPEEPVQEARWTWRNGFFPIAHVATAATVVVAACIWWARPDVQPPWESMDHAAVMGHAPHLSESPAENQRESNPDAADRTADRRTARTPHDEAPEKALRPPFGKPDETLEAASSHEAARFQTASGPPTCVRRRPAWRPPTVDTPSYTVSTSSVPESR